MVKDSVEAEEGVEPSSLASEASALSVELLCLDMPYHHDKAYLTK